MMSNNPIEAEQLYQKGREYINSKNYDEAIEYFDKAMQIQPNHDKALLMNLSDNYSKQSQSNTVFVQQEKMDRVGFEPTTSAMP